MKSEALEQEVGGRSDGGAKRRQIMEGARQVFLSAGFDGASMNDIARVAGVSKGTLYAYFNSKDDLFEEIIRAEKGQAAERLCAFLPDYSDPRAMLTDFGVRLLTRMAEPSTLALSRVVIAAAGKFPNIGRVFFEAGPLLGNHRLAERLRSLEQAGLIRAPDPERAAWHFLDLCFSGVYKKLLFGVVDTISPEDIEASVEAGVDVFLKAYGA
jgi:AcrR family transcriptional regulator